jgi:hypothetical protein
MALVGEVGSPYFLGWPLAAPFGVRQRVVGMIGGVWRGVELVQRVDDEAVAAKDLDPLAVAGVELYPAPAEWPGGMPGAAGGAVRGRRVRPVRGSTW